MKRYEVCYCVKEERYDDGVGQWETFAETDDIDEAYEKYREMKSEFAPGDYIGDHEHYIDTIAIYERLDNGVQECLESEF